MQRPQQSAARALGCAALAALAGCGASPPGAQVRPIEKTRIVAKTLEASRAVALPPSAPSAGAGPARGLRFAAPAEWTQAPARPMREVTFVVGGDPRAECYVALLPGGAGGVRANIDRWCGQMGQPALDDAAFEALERGPVGETEGPFIELAGVFRGMGAASLDDALLYGAVGSLGGATLFVKLTGPRQVVAGERERFRAFCASLRGGG